MKIDENVLLTTNDGKNYKILIVESRKDATKLLLKTKDIKINTNENSYQESIFGQRKMQHGAMAYDLNGNIYFLDYDLYFQREKALLSKNYSEHYDYYYNNVYLNTLFSFSKNYKGVLLTSHKFSTLDKINDGIEIEKSELLTIEKEINKEMNDGKLKTLCDFSRPKYNERDVKKLQIYADVLNQKQNYEELKHKMQDYNDEYKTTIFDTSLNFDNQKNVAKKFYPTKEQDDDEERIYYFTYLAHFGVLFFEQTCEVIVS